MAQKERTRLEGRAGELIENGKNFVILTTIRPDGRPQMNVVWGDMERDSIAVNSAEGRRWPENIRHNPQVALVVMNQDNPYEYVQIEGRVLEDTHEGADEHIDRLAKKYLAKDKYPFRREGEQRIKFLIEPEKVKVRGE